MRGVYSTFSALPFVRDLNFLNKEQCQSCNPVFSVPESKGIPNFFLRFKNPSFNVFFGIVRDACTGEQVEIFPIETHIELYQGDEYHFKYFIGLDEPLSAGSYYIQIPVIDALPYSFVSEDFCVKPDAKLRYKMQWTNDCPDLDMGGYNDYFNEFYLDEINLEQNVIDRTYLEKTNEDGLVERSNKIITMKPNFNVLGNDWLYESLLRVTNYDNIQLENLITDELYDLTNLEVTPNGSACEYPINILFTQSVATSNKCCPEDDIYIEPCVNCDCQPMLGDCIDCVPPGILNCDGWTITWYTDPEMTIPLEGNFPDVEDAMFYYLITKEGCESISGDYWHDAPDAGETSNENEL